MESSVILRVKQEIIYHHFKLDYLFLHTFTESSKSPLKLLPIDLLCNELDGYFPKVDVFRRRFQNHYQLFKYAFPEKDVEFRKARIWPAARFSEAPGFDRERQISKKLFDFDVKLLEKRKKFS
jgi:hypothetical protein